LKGPPINANTLLQFGMLIEIRKTGFRL